MEEMKATRDFMLAFVQTVKWWEICAAVGSYFLFSYWSQRNRRGPFCWPLVGMLPSVLININRLYERRHFRVQGSVDEPNAERDDMRSWQYRICSQNPGCLAVDLPEIPFAKAFDDAVEATLYRHVMPYTWWKLFRLLKIGKERQFHRAMKPLKEFVDDLIDSKKSVIAKVGESMSEPMSKDLLTSFICKLSDGNATISYSDKFLRDAVMNFVIAGRDTSGVALTWFFWLLSDNPRVEENIVKEISHILLKRRTHSCKDYLDMEKTLTEKELQECVYLQAAFSETLRLYPSVPLDHKGVVMEDVLPDGTCIKPGMRFLYSIYSLGRMENIWGPDCLEFKPEKWIGMSSDGQAMINHESAYKFAAFNGGPRVCLGKNMAYVQMKAAAAGILRRFQVRVVENHLVVPKISLILTMKHGLRVILTRRPSTLPLNSNMSTGFVSDYACL